MRNLHPYGSQPQDDELTQVPTQQFSDYGSDTTAGPSNPAAAAAAWQWHFGPLAQGPLSRVDTTGERLPAFGGDFQPGLYKPPSRDFANPAPLGLSGFALTTFLLSLINLGVRDITSPALVIGPAFAYGGLVQLLAGLWEFPQNNVFGASALTTYGAFWISVGIILTPGGFDIAASYPSAQEFYVAFGLYLFVRLPPSLPLLPPSLSTYCTPIRYLNALFARRLTRS